MSHLKSFEYNKLPTSSSIRLLELLGDSPEDPIRCSLITVDLDDRPEYEALSYTWGNPLPEPNTDFDQTMPIICNGQELMVTRNLNDALTHLYKPYSVDLAGGRYQKTLLHVSAESGRLDVVSALIAKGADVEALDWFGHTPLHYAAYEGHVDVIKRLLAAGANSQIRDHFGHIPLDRAKIKNNTEAISILCTLAPSLDDVRMSWKDCGTELTELHMAAKDGDSQAVELLISNRANLESRDVDGKTLLHHAASQGLTEIVTALFNAGADRYALDNTWRMPVTYADRNGHSQIADLLRPKRRQQNVGRHPSPLWRPKHYWIDAICINQDDALERNVQVGMMSRIYSSAQLVRVWLGRDDGDTELAIQATRKILPTNDQISNITWWCGVGAYQQLPLSLEEQRALVSFYRRQWFRRAWIIQEILLAKCIVMHCGDHEISWHDVIGSVYPFLDWNYGGDLERQKQETLSESSALGRILRLDQMRVYYFSREHRERFKSLDRLILAAQGFDCTDPRDEIYSLLGITRPARVDPAGEPLTDYTATAISAFCQATRHIIKETGDLSVLSYAQGYAMKPAGIPTWVPFGEVLPFQTFLDHDTICRPCHHNDPQNMVRFGSYRASQRCSQRVKPSTDPTIIRLEAIPLGVVQDVEANEIPRRLTFDPEWLRILQLMEPSTTTSEAPAEVLWQIILAGNIGRWQADYKLKYWRQDQYRLCRDWIRCSLSEIAKEAETEGRNDAAVIMERLGQLAQTDSSGKIPQPEEVKSYSGDWIATRMLCGAEDPEREGQVKVAESCFISGMMMTGRNLFILSTGHLGKGPISTRVGDSAWVIPGANVPFILRRAKSGRYHVVGEAYVHGFMRGEALEVDKVNFMEIELE